MGNQQQKSLPTSIPNPSSATPPPLQQESQIRRIMKDAQTMTVEKSKKNFRTIRKAEYQVYAQFDEETDQINGYGSLKKSGKLIFEGEFVNSLRNGYGVEYGDNNEIIYEGTYVNDLRDGWGKTKNYEGEFCRGKRSGWGVENDVTGKYEGYWKDDKYEGMGIKSYDYTIINNMFELINKEPPNGQAQGAEVPCEMYIGEWKEGKRDGLGKYKGKKEVYQGEFSNDMYHGQGSLFSNNETKKGIFHKGAFIK